MLDYAAVVWRNWHDAFMLKMFSCHRCCCDYKLSKLLDYGSLLIWKTQATFQNLRSINIELDMHLSGYLLRSVHIVLNGTIGRTSFTCRAIRCTSTLLVATLLVLGRCCISSLSLRKTSLILFSHSNKSDAEYSDNSTCF